MSNLTNYNKDGLELVIDTQTGEAFASIRATARIVDKNKSSIHDYVNGKLQGVRQMTLKNAEVQTPGGIQGVRLLSEEQIVEVVTKYKPELLAKFAKLGVRVFLHQLAGYEVKSTAIEVKPKTAIELAKENIEMAKQQLFLLEEIERQKLQLEAAKEAVEFVETIQASSTTISMGEMAKIIGTGRTRFFNKLRDMKVLMIGSTIPYQSYIEQGYFEVTENISGFPCARVTTSGQAWLVKAINRFDTKQEKLALAAKATEAVVDDIDWDRPETYEHLVKLVF